jgi:methylthioribose-1-phosphate isomerase
VFLANEKGDWTTDSRATKIFDVDPNRQAEGVPSPLEWSDGRLTILDQSLLPEQVQFVRLSSVADVVNALRGLKVRGAPVIGVCGAFGVVVGLDERNPTDIDAAHEELDRLTVEIGHARPTAVNLFRAVERTVDAARSGRAPREIRALALEEALRIQSEDREACRRIAGYGCTELSGRRRLLTHCNAGRLATTGVGTALGVVYGLAEAGEPVEVLATETRPALQGARLTTWELLRSGIPVTLLVDSAAGVALSSHMVDAVIVGCDRVALNGDVANKIGTYTLAVLAHEAGIPFYVAGPLSSFDPNLATGSEIVVEQRSADEVRGLAERATAPGVPVLNPAFDVTPARLVTAFITEAGVLRPPFEHSITSALAGAQQG